MPDFLSTVLTFSGAFGVLLKALSIVIVIFSIMLYRQVSLMNQSLKTNFSLFFQSIGFAQLIFAVLLSVLTFMIL